MTVQPFHLPVEIQTNIIQFAELEDIFAFSQTCRQLRTGLLSSEEALKERVRARIPWMEIQQPGSGLDSWLDAARMVVSRAKSMKNEPQKWCFATSNYEANITGMLKNTSVEYLDPIDCEGTPLPLSFEPLSTESTHGYNTVAGKYMSTDKPAGHILDLKTMKFEEGKLATAHPLGNKGPGKIPLYDTRRVTKTGVCPVSKLKVKGARTDDYIHVIQENDKWIHVGVCCPQRREITQEYMLDKTTCKRSPDGKTLTLDTFDLSCHYVGGGDRNVIVHLLPGDLGAFIFMHPEPMCMIMYFDGDDGMPLLTLSNYYGQIRSNKHQYPPLLKIYAGIVYIYYCDSVLIPVWADRALVLDPKSGTDPIAAMRPSMRSIRITYDFDRRLPEDTTESTDKRFIITHNRVVADFAKAKTWIVRDEGAFGYNSLVFAGRSESTDKPQFYRWSTVYANYFNKYIHRLAEDPEKTLKWFVEKTKVASKLDKLVYQECAPGFSFDQKEKGGTMVIKAMKRY